MQIPTKQKNSVKNQDRPFQHPVLLRKISRSDQVGYFSVLRNIFVLSSR